MLKEIMGSEIGGLGVFRDDGFNGLGAGPDEDNWAADKIVESLVVRLRGGVVIVWDEVGGWDGVRRFSLSDPDMIGKVRSWLSYCLERFEVKRESELEWEQRELG